MARRFTGGKLVIASHNPGKIIEIAELLAPYPVKVIGAGALNLPEPEETGATFEENAALKARLAAEGTNLRALAHDFRLLVPLFDGAPGVYSAHVARPAHQFTVALQLVPLELGVENPHVQF